VVIIGCCTIGKLLTKNEDDTVRTYFITEFEKWYFKRLMFADGWNIGVDRVYVNEGVTGYEVTFRRRK